MMRWLSLLLLVLLAWFAWALATLPPRSAALRVPAPAPGDPPVVRGAYHVHSQVSDGTGTMEEIAAAAARAGLRFVILTDHGDAFGRRAPPRYIGGVLCIEAVEISTVRRPLRRPRPARRRRTRSEARLATWSRTSRGWAGSASPRTRIPPKRELRWDEWDAPIRRAWSGSTPTRSGATRRRWRLLPTILQYPLRPPEAVASLFDRPAGLLRRWDELGARRRVVGLAAADAHARMGLGGKTDPYDELVYVKAAVVRGDLQGLRPARRAAQSPSPAIPNATPAP